MPSIEQEDELTLLRKDNARLEYALRVAEHKLALLSESFARLTAGSEYAKRPRALGQEPSATEQARDLRRASQTGETVSAQEIKI